MTISSLNNSLAAASSHHVNDMWYDIMRSQLR